MEKIVQEIYAPILEEMENFKRFYAESVASQQPLLKDVVDYLVQREGKGIRPLIVLLSAKMHGEVSKSSYIGAAAIEMIHTATLVHDDVVDDSDERRGQRSVQAAWSPQVAILTGDYLFSTALLLVVRNSEFDMLELVTQSLKELSEGELIQLAKAKAMDTSEDDYFNIIYKKTASLIAACAATGAHSATKDNKLAKIMWEVGKNIGIAFQIRDDIFDYESNNLIGKPVGNDIREGKLTLPLIHALEQVDEPTRKNILHSLSVCKQEPERVDEIISFVKQSKGIEYAEGVMQKYCNEAAEALSQFPKNPARESLMQMASYVAFRKK